MVDQVGEGVHDGVVLALILKQGAVGLLGLHIAVLGGVAEGLWEGALGEDLRGGDLTLNLNICARYATARILWRAAESFD